jgi:hypothetical protein
LIVVLVATGLFLFVCFSIAVFLIVRAVTGRKVVTAPAGPTLLGLTLDHIEEVRQARYRKAVSDKAFDAFEVSPGGGPKNPAGPDAGNSALSPPAPDL